MVYPGHVNVTVTVDINDTTCSEIHTSANTSCIANITEDRNYTVTLTLENEVGNAESVTRTFDCKFYRDILSQSTEKFSLSSARFYLLYLQ